MQKCTKQGESRFAHSDSALSLFPQCLRPKGVFAQNQNLFFYLCFCLSLTCRKEILLLLPLRLERRQQTGGVFRWDSSNVVACGKAPGCFL